MRILYRNKFPEVMSVFDNHIDEMSAICRELGRGPLGDEIEWLQFDTMFEHVDTSQPFNEKHLYRHRTGWVFGPGFCIKGSPEGVKDFIQGLTAKIGREPSFCSSFGGNRASASYAECTFRNERH